MQGFDIRNRTGLLIDIVIDILNRMAETIRRAVSLRQKCFLFAEHLLRITATIGLICRADLRIMANCNFIRRAALQITASYCGRTHYADLNLGLSKSTAVILHMLFDFLLHEPYFFTALYRRRLEALPHCGIGNSIYYNTIHMV